MVRDPKGAGLTRDQLGSNSLRIPTAAIAGTTAGVGAAKFTEAGRAGLGKVVESATSILPTRLAKKVIATVNRTGAQVGGGIDFVVGVGVGTAVTAAVLGSELLEPDKMFRITDTISLHVSEPPQVRYAAEYSNKDLGTLVGALANFGETNMTTWGTEGLAAIGMMAAKLPGALGGGDLASALSASSGVALNPFKEVIFEAVDFRSFAFKYKFLPKSQQEAAEVKRIIDLFKYHMHPEISDTKLFFIYPSEFQITYLFDGGENEYLHKFAPCVLTSMDVSYGGETFSSFKDGKPTEVNISLLFRETEVLTRDMITEQGVY